MKGGNERDDNVGQLVLDHRGACYAIKIITIGDDSKQDLDMKIALGTKKVHLFNYVCDRRRTKKKKTKGLGE